MNFFKSKSSYFNTSRVSTVALLLLSVLFISHFYKEVIFHPNDYSFSVKGDGVKNYFVYASFIKNNEASLEYQQMNYPYWEGLLFVDAHPLFSLPLNLANNWFPWISDNSIGLLNLLMIFSLVIAAYYLKKIFDLLHVHQLLGLLGAFSITLLNAQIFRLHGHFSLSYGFFVPVIIYYLLKIHFGARNYKNYIQLGFIAFAYYFIHAYAGLIASLLIIIFSLVDFNFRFNKKQLKSTIYFLSCGTIPLALYYVLAKLSDNHTGRTTNPWGLYEYHADLSTVFLPILGPFNFLKGKFFGPIHQNEEGWAYVGLATIVGLIILLLSSVYYSIKRRKFSLSQTLIQERSARVLFISTVFVLLISMLIPFRWGMDFLLDWFPIIKQFRSIGRFAIVFYFGSTIILIVLTNQFYRTLRKRNYKVLAYLTLLISPVLLLLEGVPLHEDMSTNIVRTKNIFKLDNHAQEYKEAVKQLSTQKFDALLSFPFFCVGSENFGIYGTKESHDLAFSSSYFLNLPLVANMSARSSIWESKNKMQMMSSFYPKAIAQDIEEDAKLLICSTNDGLHPNESAILDKASLIIATEKFSFYEILAGNIFETKNQKEWAQFEKIESNLKKKKGFYVDNEDFFFDFKPLGENTVIEFSSQLGSISVPQKNYYKFYDVPNDSLMLGRDYIARFWAYNHGDNFGQDKLIGIAFIKKTTDKGEWINITSLEESYEINQNWSMIEIPLHHDDPNASYSFLYKGSDDAKDNIAFKDFLFYDKDLNIYKRYKKNGTAYLMKNNHHIK